MTSFNRATELAALTEEYNLLVGFASRLKASAKIIFLVGLQHVFSYNTHLLQTANEKEEKPELLSPVYFYLDMKVEGDEKKVRDNILVHDFLHSYLRIGVTMEDEFDITAVQSRLRDAQDDPDGLDGIQCFIKHKSVLDSLKLGQGKYGFTLLNEEITALALKTMRHTL